MPELQKIAASIGLGAGIYMVSSVITSKMEAYWLGPSGVGVMGQIVTYSGILTASASVGLTQGVTQAVARAHTAKNSEALGKAIGTALIMAVFMGVVALLLSASLSSQLSRLIFGNAQDAQYVLLASPGVVFSLLYGVTESICQGLRNAKVMPQARIASALLAPALTALFIGVGGLAGAVLTVPVIWVISGTVAALLLRRVVKELGSSQVVLRFDYAMLKTLVSIGVNTFLVSLIWTFTSFATRNVVVHSTGLSGAGLYQAAWTLFFTLQNVAVLILSYYTFPKVSADPGRRARIHVINESIAFGLVLLGGGCVALSAVREFVTRIFYRGDFLPASVLLPLFGLAGSAYIVWWAAGTPLIAQGRMKTLIMLNLAAAVPAPVLTYVLLPHFALAGIGYAAILANLFAAILFFLDQHRASHFSISRDNLTILVVTSGALVAEMLINDDGLLTVPLRMVVAGAWAVLALRITDRHLSWSSILRSLRLRIGAAAA